MKNYSIIMVIMIYFIITAGSCMPANKITGNFGQNCTIALWLFNIAIIGVVVIFGKKKYELYKFTKERQKIRSKKYAARRRTSTRRHA